MSHIRALDGLRAVAIAMMVAFHYGYLDFAWVSVQLFFVLSGFLITRILLEAREQPLASYLGRFWRRRALRILPLYFGYLLLLSAVFVATGAPAAYRENAVYLFTYTYNLSRPLLLAGSPAFTHFWTLCVEEQFYLLWPLAVFFLGPRRLPQLAIAMIAVAPVARLLLGDHWMRTIQSPFDVGDSIYWSPICQMDSLATGALVAVLRLPERAAHPRWIFAATLALALGLAGRQAILSGYPLWPSGLLAMPVDWRVSRAVLTDYREGVQAWARWPEHTPQEVGSWGDWIGRWAENTLTNGAVAAALVLIAVAAVLPLAFRSELDRAERRARASAAAVVLIPSVAALVIWFVVAPDVRFAFGWIWLLGIGLVAWLAPTPAGLGTRLLPVVATAVILGIGMARAFMSNPIDLRVPAVGDGPFGSVLPDTTETRSFTTGSGLRLVVPASGDQCWQVIWCTPYPNPRLTQRGRRLQDGFSVSGR